MLFGIITKKLRKELHDTRKILEQEKQKGKEEAQERQELEIRIWKLEGELRTYQYREKRIRDVLKYEYWERICPLYKMEAAELKRSVRLENLFFDQDGKTWGVVECYCLQCGKVLRASYFSQEVEALRYLAMKQILGIAPAFDTCMECYQESLKACA